MQSQYICGVFESGQPAMPRDPITDPGLIAEIHRLREQAEWMGRMVEDEESAFTCGDDGTIQWGMTSQFGSGEQMFSYRWAVSQCLFRPSYMSSFFINEAQHRLLRARSRAFCSVNPYWHGVQHSVRTHVVATGTNWTVVPIDPDEDVPDKKIAKFQRELDDFYNGEGVYEDSYRDIQLEKLDRKSRDGEYFLQYIEEDKLLRVRFVEPLLVWNPPGVSQVDGVWFGIKFKFGDYERPLRYHVKTTDYFGGETKDDPLWARGLEADKIQHRKVNVDKGCPRGIPDTYWTQQRFEQSVRTLKAMGTLAQVRSKIAAIRTHVNALSGSVQPMLSTSAAATIAGPRGPENVLKYPEGSFIDISDQSTWQFPSQNIETDKIVASVQADLQSCATSVGLADYMVSGNLGNSSYASSMVASGPVVKTFQDKQAAMHREDRQVIHRLAETAIKAGRLDEDTLDLLTVEQHGASLAASDGVQEAQARQLECQNKVLSKTTWRQIRGYDPRREETNIKSEAKTELEVQTIQGVAPGQPGGPGGTATAGGGNGTGKVRVNARPFTADQEPRQQQRASGATREEEGRMVETAHDAYSQDLPTQAEMEMSKVLLTDEWLAQTKGEILALPRMTVPADPSTVPTEYEPGVKGMYLGIVDGQEVYAVDMRAVEILHRCPGVIVAGNHMKWDFIPADKIIVDWAFMAADRSADLLHEVGETRLMAVGKWPYAMAHRTINAYETAFLLEQRPDLVALKKAA